MDNYQILVCCEIIKNAEALKLEDNLDSERHRKAVRRGKLLLKMLSTVGHLDMSRWLKSAEVVGNFYKFKDYLIVKKTTYKKDLIDIKQVNDVLGAVKKCCQDNIGATQDFSRLVMQYSQLGYNINTNNAYFLEAALTLCLQKAYNVIRKPQFQIGEIYTNEATPSLVENIDFISLYRQDRVLDEDEAINELEKILEPDSGNGIFQKVQLDKRTHWGLCYSRDNDNPLMHSSKKSLSFYDDNILLGKVMLDFEGILCPVTYWSKGHEQNGRPLNVPFPDQYPLWQSNLIRKEENRNTPIIISDSLCGVYEAHQQIVEERKSQEQELDLLNRKDGVVYYGGCDSRFEEEMQRHVKERDNWNSVNTPSWGSEYQKARIAFRLKTPFEFTKGDFSCSAVQLDCDIEWHSKLSLPLGLKKDNSEISREHPCYSGRACPPAMVADADLFGIFKNLYSLIKKYIEAARAKDANRKAEIELRLNVLNKVIWTTWYGGDYTALDVKWATLKNRKVFYVIRKNDKLSYQTALKAYSRIKEIKSIDISFVDCDFLSSRNNSDSTTFPSRIDETCLTPEVFVERAKERFDLDEKMFAVKTRAEGDVDDLPDCYDPENDRDEIIEDDFLLEPLIREKSISLLYSEPGVGKSWIALSIAKSLLYACPTFLSGVGWRAVKPRRGLIVAREMSSNSCKNRVKGLNSLDKGLA